MVCHILKHTNLTHVFEWDLVDSPKYLWKEIYRSKLSN